jgi:uncharacterized HhH-GPD family protein
MPAIVTDRLHFTGNDDADRLLVEEPLALVIGFGLDQQVPVPKAFSGPFELKRRLGHLDPAEIAGMDPAALEEVFRQKPAIHRFPGSMARRTQELCAVVAEEYGGDASRIWREAVDGADLDRRLRDLPGFGDMKVRSLVAVLGKRLGVQPPGWEEVAADHFCLGDVDSSQRLAEYQAAKRAHKAALRAAKSTDQVTPV